MVIRLKEKYVWGKIRTYPDCKISQYIVDMLPKDCSNKKPVTITEDQIKILEKIGDIIGFKVYIEKAIISPDTVKRRIRHLSREINRKKKQL